MRDAYVFRKKRKTELRTVVVPTHELTQMAASADV
jgi:hypothetical protein